MESAGYSEMFVPNYQTARHNVPFYLQFIVGKAVLERFLFPNV